MYSEGTILYIDHSFKTREDDYYYITEKLTVKVVSCSTNGLDFPDTKLLELNVEIITDLKKYLLEKVSSGLYRKFTFSDNIKINNPKIVMPK